MKPSQVAPIAQLRRVARKLKNMVRPPSPYAPPDIGFADSQSYWDERYRVGGNSGAGSYGRLAEFKADFLNRFVSEHRIDSVIEFGSGDGAQLKLADYPAYVGVDVSAAAIERCTNLFADNPEYRFVHSSEFPAALKAPLTLSLDVIYHLIEDEVFAGYMNQLFDASERFVILYSSDLDDRPAPHVRHRNFTAWIKSERPDFRFVERRANPYPYDPANPDETSFADFFVYERVGSDGDRDSA